MITVIKGDDKDHIANFISTIKTKYNLADTLNIDDDSLTSATIKDLILAKNLFNPLKFVLFTPHKNAQVEFDDNFYKQVIEDKNTILIIDLSYLKKSLEIVKKLKTFKEIKLEEFVKPRSFDTFKFADEIVINYNKAGALKVLESIAEDELPILVSSVMYNLRCYFSVKYKNEFSKTLKPFVVKKVSMAKITEEQGKNIYDKLLTLDYRFKSESTSLKDLIIDFVISI